MNTVQATYEEHVAERKAYGFIPLDYETWLQWHLYDLSRKIKPDLRG